MDSKRALNRIGDDAKEAAAASARANEGTALHAFTEQIDLGKKPDIHDESIRRDVDAYRDAVNRRLHVRPGLTGLWQVSGRANLSWEESVRLDLRYVDNWSVAMDLLILWKTGRAVFGASGAY